MEKTQKLNKLALNQETVRNLSRVESLLLTVKPCSGVKSVCAPVCTP
jgi:hypothetical protein